MMNIQGANDLERSIVEHILKKYAPEYERHLPYLSIDRCERTGVGNYLYFKYSGHPPIFSSENKTVGQSVYAEIEGLEGGAGFMLYIDGGRITMLESFSHGSESWPAYISRFKIQDL